MPKTGGNQDVPSICEQTHNRGTFQLWNIVQHQRERSCEETGRKRPPISKSCQGLPTRRMYLSSYKKYIFDVTTSRHHLRCQHQTANNLSFSPGLNTVFPDCLGTKQTLDTYSLLLLSAAVQSSGLLETYKGTAEGIYLPPVWTQRIASVMGNWGSHPLVLPMGLEWGGGDTQKLN